MIHNQKVLIFIPMSIYYRNTPPNYKRHKMEYYKALYWSNWSSVFFQVQRFYRCQTGDFEGTSLSKQVTFRQRWQLNSSKNWLFMAYKVSVKPLLLVPLQLCLLLCNQCLELLLLGFPLFRDGFQEIPRSNGLMVIKKESLVNAITIFILIQIYSFQTVHFFARDILG